MPPRFAGRCEQSREPDAAARQDVARVSKLATPIFESPRDVEECYGRLAMAAPGSQIDSKRLCLTVLQALSAQSDADRISLAFGQLHVGTERLDAGGPAPDDVDARIRVLARSLGVLDVHPGHAADVLAAECGRPGGMTAQEVLAALATGTIADRSDADATIRWHAAMRRRLDHLRGVRAIDRLAGSGIGEGRGWLELEPLLSDWPRRLRTDPRWVHAESLSDVAPFRIDDVWVDLQLVDRTEQQPWRARFGRAPDRGTEEDQWLAEPAPFALDRLQRCAVILGAPGAGKTTFVKWIARRLVSDPDGRFLLPLIVPLRAYSLEKAVRPGEGLVDFALETAGIRSAEQRSLWITALHEIARGEQRTVLFLLDGWDEVPDDARDRLLREVEALVGDFATVITSRRSGSPWSLPAERRYEIASLTDSGVDKLVRAWCATAGRERLIPEVQEHLQRHPDLLRLARNPFLLTLVCATFRPGIAGVPASRTELYRATIDRVIAQRKGRFDEGTRRSLARLSLWLFEEAEGAPRYVFSVEDLGQSPGVLSAKSFAEVVEPSRLVSRLDVEKEDYHFVHATFQEYLAATSLLDPQDRPRLASRLARHAKSAAWQEILHFAAGLSGEDGVFWDAMRALAATPDLAAAVYLRIARGLAEVRVRDGGRALLGVDVRERLFEAIERGVCMNAFADAAAELDEEHLVQKLAETIERSAGKRRYRLIRALGRLRGPDAASVLLSRVLATDKQAAAVASYAAANHPSQASLGELRRRAGDPTEPEQRRAQAIRTLGRARDHAAVDLLLTLAREGQMASDAILALGHVGSDAAVRGLVDLLRHAESPDDQEEIVSALGRSRNMLSRDHILWEIARRSPQDPLLMPLLEALQETPIPRDVEVLLSLLRSAESPETRKAAAWALADAGHEDVPERLLDAAARDPESPVRVAALGALRSRARAEDAPTLAAITEDPHRSPEERANALDALGEAAIQHGRRREGPELARLFLAVCRRALSPPRGTLALHAAMSAHAAGPEIAPRLVELLEDPSASDVVREQACGSLARLGLDSANDVLLRLVARAPNAEDDEEDGSMKPADRVARAAARGLARTNPLRLLESAGTTARDALIHLSVEDGCLVYEDHVVLPDGSVLRAGDEPVIPVIPVATTEPEAMVDATTAPAAEPPPEVAPVESPSPALPSPAEPPEGKKEPLLVLREGDKTVFVGGHALALRPKYFDWLLGLVTSHQRGELLKFNGRDSYHQKIRSELKKALREAAARGNADAKRLEEAIENVPKEGYRITLPSGETVLLPKPQGEDK